MGGRRSEKEMIFSFSPLRSNSRSSPFFFFYENIRSHWESPEIANCYKSQIATCNKFVCVIATALFLRQALDLAKIFLCHLTQKVDSTKPPLLKYFCATS